MIKSEYPVPHWKRANIKWLLKTITGQMWRRGAENQSMYNHIVHLLAFADDPLTYLCWVVDWLISLNEDIAPAF